MRDVAFGAVGSSLGRLNLLFRDKCCPTHSESIGRLFIAICRVSCRFQNHPLVVANPNPIRFYAGAPLIASNGHRLGAM